MTPIDWLRANAPGFDQLPEADREAIMHFSLLWSFFEARALGSAASANAIVALVQGWEDDGRLDVAPFDQSLSYFKDRYFQNGAATPNFQGLALRPNDNPATVEAVLKGENTSTRDCVAALLIVVYRLRNNLFHGVKWAYGIRDQLSNFNNANATIMAALEMHDFL